MGKATVALAMEVARLGNTSLTEAVNDALRHRLEQLKAAEEHEWKVWMDLMAANPWPEGLEFERDQPPMQERPNWP
jgi:hypothetical protein